MKHKFTSDMYGNEYYSNELDGRWCLIVCKIISKRYANEFLMDNKDCSVLAVIDGLVLIAFTNDIGKRRVI